MIKVFCDNCNEEIKPETQVTDSMVNKPGATVVAVADVRFRFARSEGTKDICLNCVCDQLDTMRTRVAK